MDIITITHKVSRKFRITNSVRTRRAAADSVPTVVAAQVIMGQIQDMYRIIGFEKEIKTKQLGLEMLEEKIQDLDEFWDAKIRAIDALTYLAARGVTKEHVLDFHNFFRANKNKFNLATLVADLQRYVSMKHVLKQTEQNITARTYQSESLHLELISLLEDRKNIENEIAVMSKRVDSLKKQMRPSASEDNSPKAKLDLPREEREKGRKENSHRVIIDPEATITAFTKSRSGQPGNDSAASAEQISWISNARSAKAKTRSTTASSDVAGINNQTDIQTSTTEKEKEKETTS